MALLAAAPVPDPAAARKDREARHLGGEVPSATSLPSGCRFRLRCPRAEAICSAEEPRWPLSPKATRSPATSRLARRFGAVGDGTASALEYGEGVSRGGEAMGNRVDYDEFGLFHENAEEYGD
jgi:oligopeptide/dipeptide ABC transporter ATP-binding protein